MIWPWNYLVFTPDGVDRVHLRGRERGRVDEPFGDLVLGQRLV